MAAERKSLPLYMLLKRGFRPIGQQTGITIHSHKSDGSMRRKGASRVQLALCSSSSDGQTSQLHAYGSLRLRSRFYFILTC